MGWFFNRERKPDEHPDAMMWLNDRDYISRWQCYEGIFGIGGTGSGKSSTLSRLMAAFVSSGAGMLFLTASTDDFGQIARTAREKGREADLVRFAPDERWRFDFLDWELSSPGGSVASAAQVMQDLVEFSTRTSTQHSAEPFWALASAREIRMAIALVNFAKGRCSESDVYEFVSTMPMTSEEIGTEGFRESYCGQILKAAWEKSGTEDSRDVELAARYLAKEWVRLGEKTIGSLQAQTMNVLEKFMQSNVRELVASGVTNISPGNLDEGKLIVIDTAVLKYREPGQMVQMVWKLLTQRHALRRPIAPQTRDIVIWADEAQLHAVPSVDSMTQAVARKHRLIQVAITQNLPLLISVLKSREDAISWISNLQTKFIFANSDKDTNDYFSALLGSSKHLFGNSSMNTGPYDLVGDLMGQPPPQGSFSMNETWHPDVPPEEFTQLRKGGKENDFMVDCFVFQGGRKFSNGKTWVKASLRQRV